MLKFLCKIRGHKWRPAGIVFAGRSYWCPRCRSEKVEPGLSDNLLREQMEEIRQMYNTDVVIPWPENND